MILKQITFSQNILIVNIGYTPTQKKRIRKKWKERVEEILKE
jgi:hypothetical protein